MFVADCSFNSHKMGLVSIQFIHLSSNISSTESDVNIRIGKAWTAIDRLTAIEKSDLSDKIERELFQTVVISVLLHGCTTKTQRKRQDKELDVNYTRILFAIGKKF